MCSSWHEENESENKMISAIIRCKNEEQWIGHAVQSVLDSVDDPEIIVVDNESQDESMDVVRMFETFSNVRPVSIQDYSPGKALNMSVKQCEHQYVLILSAHCVITAFGAAKVEDELSQYICIFGRQTPIYRGRRLLRRYIWNNFGDESCANMWSKYENRHFLHNGFAVYNKDFLLDNPFDEKLYGKEDRYWAAKMI